MNIFLPFENDVKQSLESLDDLRLIKQVLETHQLLNNAIKELNGEEIKGYSHHPVYLFYKDNINFLAYYGKQACLEYNYRFGKHHTLFYSPCLPLLQANSPVIYLIIWKVLRLTLTIYAQQRMYLTYFNKNYA